MAFWMTPLGGGGHDIDRCFAFSNIFTLLDFVMLMTSFYAFIIWQALKSTKTVTWSIFWKDVESIKWFSELHPNLAVDVMLYSCFFYNPLSSFLFAKNVCKEIKVTFLWTCTQLASKKKWILPIDANIICF